MPCAFLFKNSSGHMLCTCHNDQKVDHTLPQQIEDDQWVDIEFLNPPVHLLNIVTGHCTAE